MERHPGSATSMAAIVPSSRALTTSDDVPVLPAPEDLVDEYLRLVRERRALEDRLAFVRAELEMCASRHVHEGAPRGRFVSARGAVAARSLATCVFDRAVVARELQRMGKLAEVAVLQGPGLARYLAREPVVAARLGELVRPRRSIVLMATE